MTNEEWDDLNCGDVLVNKLTQDAYVVSNVSQYEEKLYSLTRTVIARNPDEWERRRKTVDARESNS